MAKGEMLIDESKREECPFGVVERFCEYQETRARDLVSALQGDLKFFCKLKRLEDCPRIELGGE